MRTEKELRDEMELIEAQANVADDKDDIFNLLQRLVRLIDELKEIQEATKK